MLPDEYSAYSDKFNIMLSQGESMWDRQLGSIKAVEHQIEL